MLDAVTAHCRGQHAPITVTFRRLQDSDGAYCTVVYGWFACCIACLSIIPICCGPLPLLLYTQLPNEQGNWHRQHQSHCIPGSGSNDGADRKHLQQGDHMHSGCASTIGQPGSICTHRAGTHASPAIASPSQEESCDLSREYSSKCSCSCCGS